MRRDVLELLPGEEAAIDPVMAVACAACAGALALASPLAVGLGSALVLVAWALRRPARRAFRAPARKAVLAPLVAALAFAIAAHRAEDAVARHARVRAALGPPTGMLASSPASWPARCTGAGEIVRSPVSVSGALRFELAVDESACAPDRGGRGASAVGARVAVVVADGELLASEVAALGRGDRVRFVAELAPVHLLRNPGATSSTSAAWASAARREVVLSGAALDLARASPPSPRAWIDRARAHARARIRATFSEGTEAMARALVLGEDDVAPEDRRAFQASGLSHLLAVSGMHLVLVVASVVGALRAVLVRIPAVASRVEPGRIAATIGIPLAFVYADMAGGSGSAERAAWMSAAALAARALARRPSAWRSLALSVLAMVVVDPLAPFDMSFGLSVAATLGLLVVGRRLDAWLASRLPAPFALARAPMAATIGASVACAPLLAAMAPELPVASVVANVLAVPVGEVVALPLCLVHALLAPLPPAEAGAATVAAGALEVVRWIARVFEAFGGGVPCPAPTALEDVVLATAAGLVAFAAIRVRAAIALAAYGLVLCEAWACRAGAPTGVLRVTFLDVAQGDAALIDLPDGRAMLVDAGGLVGSPFDVGERVIAPVLRARRRAALDVVVLSHPHPDHFLGLERGLRRVSVRALWDTGQGESEGAGPVYASVLADVRRRGGVVERPDALCGARDLGGVRVEVLAPCPGPDGDLGPNDNSLVLRLTYGRRRFLFVGDAERIAEAKLLARERDRLRADVLKVGHHGSRTSSSPAFLAAVAPEVAVVSSGVRNRFGHPAAPTLVALAHAGARTLRTDLDGAVTVTTDGDGLDVTTAEEPWAW